MDKQSKKSKGKNAAASVAQVIAGPPASTAPIKDKLIEPKEVAEPAAPSVAARLAAAQKKRITEDFANAVAVIMRAPKLRNMRVSNLEWLLLPPLLAGQCRIAFSKPSESGPLFPSALVLWARVSDDVDKMLSENLTKTPKLTARDWTSGSNNWLILTAGELQGIAVLVKKLQETIFRGQTVKMLSQKPDGTIFVRSLLETPTSASSDSKQVSQHNQGNSTLN